MLGRSRQPRLKIGSGIGSRRHRVDSFARRVLRRGQVHVGPTAGQSRPAAVGSLARGWVGFGDRAPVGPVSIRVFHDVGEGREGSRVLTNRRPSDRLDFEMSPGGLFVRAATRLVVTVVRNSQSSSLGPASCACREKSLCDPLVSLGEISDWQQRCDSASLPGGGILI